jgi:hypothetical protein
VPKVLDNSMLMHDIGMIRIADQRIYEFAEKSPEQQREDDTTNQ